MLNATALNERYAIASNLRFKQLDNTASDSLINAEITNAHAKASICLQGGQVLSWQPMSTAEPVLWMSNDAKFSAGKSIRGGIPVCWPWFGAHATNETFPAHGFARTEAWQVKGSRQLNDGTTELCLTMPINATMQKMWRYRAQLELLINVGETLKIALITHNLGKTSFNISEALHTYFRVSDIARVLIKGLDGVHFHDKADDWSQGDQTGSIALKTEVDRVYVNSGHECSIFDSGFSRRITITKVGSKSTIVWNPAAKRAAQMGDLGDEGWKRFVCVESGNALVNAVNVPAGKSHSLAVEYRVEKL
jgi:D-hexose-6-phosphate mutarotase